ncbi:MAG: deoxyribonuclease IV [Chloroflexota bacterium]
MRIGAHVSAAGGIDKAVARAQEIGAECVQVFPSAPQGWAFKPLDEQVAARFRDGARDVGIGPNVLHAIYLVTLGADDEALVARSKLSLSRYLDAAAELRAMGVIMHLGSHKGRGVEGAFSQVAEALREVLAGAPRDVSLLLENSAGMGNHLGSKFAELGAFIRELADPRVGVCLDTQHAFAAGYDLTTPAGVAAVMDEFEREVGTGLLRAVHVNDSKPPLGGGVDRHENIGQGQMGMAAFEAIMAHPAFGQVPFYLEVPGLEGKGPDVPNVEALKAIRERLGIKIDA